MYKVAKAELEMVIAEKKALLNSTSQKVTKPLRRPKDWLLTKSS